MSVNKIPSFIKRKFGWELMKDVPSFLKKYKWRPKYVFFEPRHSCYIAVDIVFNQLISTKIYEKEALVAVKENDNLYICLLSSSRYDYDVLKKFCKRKKLGLKVYTSYDIGTVIPLQFEKIGRIKKVRIKREGWFPQIILEEAKKINKISFATLIKDLANKLERNRAQEKQFNLIKKYIDKILQSCPDFIGDSMPLLKLTNFEKLLEFSNIENRDHVFHSVRVFIIGCIIIDRFYKNFRQYQKDIFPGIRTVNLEYMWLLSSLFHDIGRIKQKAYLIYKRNPKKKNKALMEGIEKEMSAAWKDADYQQTLGSVVCLITHCCLKKEDREPFTGFDMNYEIDKDLSTILTQSYNKCISHGVISCFELVPDLLKGIRIAKKRTNNTFLKYHILPAAVAIALHDWTIWENLRQTRVFPIKMESFPIAALLIYIDTWDDYKRGDDQKISIDKIHFTDKSVTIYITWCKDVDYLEEKRKYKSFKKNILFSNLKFNIKISNEL